MSSKRVVELARSGDIVVNKVYGLSPEEFRREHSSVGVPVVLGDAIDHWKARSVFTFDYFEREFGEREVEVHGKPCRMSDFIDLMRRSTFENPAPYPGKLSLDRDFPELLPFVTPRHPLMLPDRIGSRWLPHSVLGHASSYEIFFGGPGGTFPYVHYDYMGLHALINQLVGEKEFIVVPPWQTDCVYPDPRNPWVSQVNDLKNPDLKRFPKAANATVLSFVVGPGETMFIPNGWWHTTVSRTLTISVAYDLLDRTNWGRFKNEVRTGLATANRGRRAAVLAYVTVVGVLLSMFE